MKRSTRDLFDKQILNDKFSNLLREYNERSKKLIQNLSEDKEHLVGSIVSKDKIHDLIQLIDNRFNGSVEQIENKLLPLVEHINRLSFDIDEEQVQGAYKAQYDQMKFQWEQTRDLAQLGIAVEIIDHEFSELYAKINNQLNISSPLVKMLFNNHHCDCKVTLI